MDPCCGVLCFKPLTRRAEVRMTDKNSSRNSFSRISLRILLTLQLNASEFFVVYDVTVTRKLKCLAEESSCPDQGVNSRCGHEKFFWAQPRWAPRHRIRNRRRELRPHSGRARKLDRKFQLRRSLKL